jgi:hypothetical protein
MGMTSRFGSTVLALLAVGGCGSSLRVSKDAAKEAGHEAAVVPALDAVVLTGADAGTDAATSPDADPNVIPWLGADATVTFVAAADTPDGATYPPIYAVPGTAMISHTPLVAPTPDLTFRAPDNGEPQYVDLDGDGLVDILINKITAVSFYRQQSDGTFQPMRGITLPAKSYFDLIQLADLNRDGLLDVVMCLHGNGDGYHSQLAAFLQYPEGFHDTPDQPIDPIDSADVGCDRILFFTVADMNGDGRLDIVVLTKTEHGEPPTIECRYDTLLAQVFQQDETGAFTKVVEFSPHAISTSCQYCGFSLAAGDVDRDGKGDLAVLLEGTVGPLTSPGGYDTVLFTQAGGGFPAAPTQTLVMGQYLTTVAFSDVNGDGRLDVLVRPGPVGEYDMPRDLSQTKIGMSGVFLQNADGTFETTARTVSPDGWLPAGTDTKTQPIGLDIRDVDGDGIRDIVLDRKAMVEGLFRQESGLFGANPDVAMETIFADQVAASKLTITATFIPAPGASVASIGNFNRLAYAIADMDGDGRQDVVSGFAPFAPNNPVDPATGQYPFDGFQPNTYTDFRIHHQRAITRRILTRVQWSRVAVEERLLQIRATLLNLASTDAKNVRVRLLQAASPFLWQTDLSILRSGIEGMNEYTATELTRNEDAIKGTPLGPDILIPTIAAGEEIPLSVDVPVGLVAGLDMRCLFILVDPEESTNVLLKRSYDFIASK